MQVSGMRVYTCAYMSTILGVGGSGRAITSMQTRSIPQAAYKFKDIS